jgi:predicted transposase/invertase (TIGR01784 family)
MEIHTLELQKLPETPGADDKEDELLNWLRLIRSNKEEEIDMLATKTTEMGHAVARLKQLSSDERARMLYEAREMARMDEDVRRRAAEKQGLQQGLQKGIQQGIQKGRAEGEQNKTLEMAKKMLKRGIDHETIVDISGMSLDEILALAD